MSLSKKPKAKKLHSASDLQNYARQNYVELLPITEMMKRGFFGTLAPRGMVGVDSFIFSLNKANKLAKIQSKYTVGSTSIPLDTVHFDFLVVYRDVIKNKGVNQHGYPTTYVIPKKELLKRWDGAHVTLSQFEDFIVGEVDDADPWQSITEFLS